MKYEKWGLKPEPAAPWLFTLTEEVVRKKKDTGEEYTTEMNIAYGLPLEKGLRMIASLASDKSCIGNYLKDFERISNIIK